MKNSSTEKRIRRLRSKYRKRTVIVGIVMLVIGIVLGVIADQKLLPRKDETAVTMVTPVETPTAEPEPTATPEAEPETWTEATESTETENEPTEAPADAPEPTQAPEPEPTDEATQAPEAATQAPEAEPTQAPEGIEKSGPEEESFTIAMDDPGASAEPTAVPTATPVPEITMSPEPTATPEPSPAPGPTTLAIVPFGESYTFDAQITPDGRARYKVEDGEPFETVTFTLTMKDYLLPSDYSAKWGTKYKLKGTEAGAGFDLTLGDYTGSCVIIPQNILTVVLQSESGETKNPGFQMTDAEINGQNNVEILPGATKTFWKRYTFSNAGEPMEYLSVSACVNGSVQTVLFELKSDVVPTPDPQTLYASLTRGDKSDAVIDLQKRLIDLGYLSGEADGNYGEMTQTAVAKAQKDFGMEESGTATPEFQAMLFADAEPTPVPEATEPAEAPAGESAN